MTVGCTLQQLGVIITINDVEIAFLCPAMRGKGKASNRTPCRDLLSLIINQRPRYHHHMLHFTRDYSCSGPSVQPPPPLSHAAIHLTLPCLAARPVYTSTRQRLLAWASGTGLWLGEASVWVGM
ncbi:hypothetical protein BDZ91DRAFT_541910 [Kalaharituber pfeilii]|nr:hypothetical protein BDZ91DRAFT_541910 [Kalaharituber pfeilii]